MARDPETTPARVGVFGGTFDPFHLGHLVVAQDAVEALGLERFIFIPSGIPPHKAPDPGGGMARGVTPAPLRLEMVQEAVASDPRFQVSDLEVRRPGPSYTVDTLRELRSEGVEDPFFLMGVDQLAGFAGWREPREVAGLARLVVMAREGEDPAAVDPGMELDFRVLPVTRIDLSSSRLRQRAAEGRSLRYLVPEEVRRIIRREGLYLS